MDEEIRVKLNKLLEEFEINVIIYNHDFLNKLKEYDDEKLLQILDKLSEPIGINEEIHMYSKLEKDNLYDVLTYYRERFKNEEVYNKVNEYIRILNSSNDQFSGYYYLGQYHVRYGVYEKYRKIAKEGINIDIIKEKTFASMINDYNFLFQLLYLDSAEFVLNNLGSELAFSNLNNLLFRYCYFILDPTLANKVMALLESNLNNMETNCELERYNCSVDLGMKSKKLIKLIKKMTR